MCCVFAWLDWNCFIPVAHLLLNFILKLKCDLIWFGEKWFMIWGCDLRFDLWFAHHCLHHKNPIKFGKSVNEINSGKATKFAHSIGDITGASNLAYSLYGKITISNFTTAHLPVKIQRCFATMYNQCLVMNLVLIYKVWFVLYPNRRQVKLLVLMVPVKPIGLCMAGQG